MGEDMKKENRFQKLREEFSEKRRDKDHTAKIYSQREMYNEMIKAGFKVSLNKIKKIESDQYGVEIDAETLRAYKWKFDVSADWLIDSGVKTRKITGNVASASRLTGLTDESIETLIKLKSGKYYNQYKFDYALHVINLILSNYENANFFELIYHFLFGDYDTMGHYDDMGQVVYDGSEVFLSDRYNANKMSIDSELVNKAILQVIVQQLEDWKKSLERKKDNFGKIFPSQEDLLRQAKEKYRSTEKHIEHYKELDTEYNQLTSDIPIDFERLFCTTQELITAKNVLIYNHEELVRLNVTLKQIYKMEYHEKEIDDFLKKLEIE